MLLSSACVSYHGPMHSAQVVQDEKDGVNIIAFDLNYQKLQQANTYLDFNDNLPLVGLSLHKRWPLFAGGNNLFSLRNAQELKNQKELVYEDKKKQVETNVANAWSNYQSSKGVLESVRSP